MRKLVNVAVGSFASFGHQPVTSGPRPKQRTSSRQPSWSVTCHERKWPTSFDHLVGAGEQRGRHRQPQRFCSLQVE